MYETNRADLNVNAPAAYAAGASPLEWPTTDDGLTPQDRSRSTTAICIAVVNG